MPIVCSMGTSPLKTNFADACLCTNCGDCVGMCNKGAISFSFGGVKKGGN
ncbi:MAG: hypothetical protein IKN16_02495 [Selenomonadaceae bacterium]|nr:hypothetical protein [Selenomonadaceae bacterium]